MHHAQVIDALISTSIGDAAEAWCCWWVTGEEPLWNLSNDFFGTMSQGPLEVNFVALFQHRRPGNCLRTSQKSRHFLMLRCVVIYCMIAGSYKGCQSGILSVQLKGWYCPLLPWNCSTITKVACFWMVLWPTRQVAMKSTIDHSITKDLWLCYSENVFATIEWIHFLVVAAMPILL